MYALEAARRAPWFVVYVAAGVGVLLNLLGETYFNAVAVCNLYSHLSFQEKLREEMIKHSTWLPLLHVRVPTLHLLSTYVVIYAVKHWGLLDRSWPLLFDLLSARWLYHQMFEILPTHLSFVFSEPDLPELLTDDETQEGIEDDEDRDMKDVLASLFVDEDTCNEALAKLVQVKQQFAHRTISRPDDWLVYDPVKEQLVLQNRVKHTKNTARKSHSTDPSDHIEDRQALECAIAKTSSPEVASGTRPLL